MIFTFDGGTDQQQQWVRDAIAECTYPLNDLKVSVTFKFLDTLPTTSELLGHSHAYMVTDGFIETGPFTVSIAKWADDPTNPNLLGLPNPPADVYGFFKESVVHELGHVVHYTQLPAKAAAAGITYDEQKGLAANQFWTDSIDGGSGRRYGALSDWSDEIWADNMAEAIAETFKCTFYPFSQLIYQNRTEWSIDSGNFDTLMQMLLPVSTLPTTGRAIVKVTDIDFGNPPPTGGSGSTIDQYFSLQIQSQDAVMTLAISNQRAIPYGSYVDGGDTWVPVGTAFGIMGVTATPGAQGLGIAVGDIGANAFNGEVPVYVGAIFQTAEQDFVFDDPATHLSTFDIALASGARMDGDPPIWIALNLTAEGATGELWITDPVLGGSPVATTPTAPWPLPGLPSQSGMTIVAQISGSYSDGSLVAGGDALTWGFFGFGKAVIGELSFGDFHDNFSVVDLLQTTVNPSSPFNPPVYVDPSNPSQPTYALAGGIMAIENGELVSSPCAASLGEIVQRAYTAPYPFIPPSIGIGPPEGGAIRLSTRV